MSTLVCELGHSSQAAYHLNGVGEQLWKDGHGVGDVDDLQRILCFKGEWSAACCLRVDAVGSWGSWARR